MTIILNRRVLLAGAAAAMVTRPALAKPERDLSAVQAVLDGVMASGKLPGVAASVGVGLEPARFLAAGKIAHDSETAVNGDTLFRVMSMSKPVTGMAVMMLIEDGKIKLDQPLADFIPGFVTSRVAIDATKSLETRPAKGQITIRHMLTHTSGLGYFSRLPTPLRNEYIRQGLVPVRTQRGATYNTPAFAWPPTLAEFAARAATVPLVADPGTAWTYSMAPDVLGHVIEQVSGKTFDAFLHERLFGPLGMTSTFFTVPQSEAHRFTTLYTLDTDQPPVVDDRATSICFEPPPLIFGGSGIISTPRDYDRFLLMLAGEGAIGKTRVMKQATAQLAMSNLTPAGVTGLATGTAFGALGQVVLSTQPDGRGPGAFGWYGGMGTVAFADRKLGVRVGAYGQYVVITAKDIPFRPDVIKAVYKV